MTQVGVQFAGTLVTFTASAGEANSVTMIARGTNDEWDNDYTVTRFADTVPLTAGPGCTQVDANTVDCVGYTESFYSDQQQRIVVNLGDRDDTFSSTYFAEAGVGNSWGVPGFTHPHTTVDGGSGADTISGAGKNILQGGAGNDTINGGAVPNTIEGGDGSDTLVGGASDDVISGGSGSDTLRGGTGNDVILGGYGTDSMDGGDGFDTADFSANVYDFEDLYGCGCTIYYGVNVTLDGVANDGNLYWDTPSQDGMEPVGDNVQQTIEKVIGTSADDTLSADQCTGFCQLLPATLVGAGGNDTLLGGSSDDTLSGGTGNDNIQGGMGSDRLEETGSSLTLTPTSLTGLGSDTLSGIDSARLEGTGGNDRLDASAVGIPVTLLGSCGNDTLIGGDGADHIFGGPDHWQSCFQASGADVLTGGPGDDLLDGGIEILSRGDRDLLSESGNVNFTLADDPQGELRLTGLGTDKVNQIARIELTGGPGNNTLDASGNSYVPVVLDGGAGIDVLRGGALADELTGGPGGDSLDGGNGTDVVIEEGDADFALTDVSLAGPGGTDSLTSVERAEITGGGGNNTINGSGFSGAQTLRGGAGDDNVTGGTGIDSVNGDGGDDVLNGGPDTVNDTLDGGPGTNRVVASVNSNITLTNTSLLGQGNDALLNIQGATLTGGPGDNVLNASAYTNGPVTLDGAGGQDTLLGGSANDTLRGGPGVDIFDAGGGDDSVEARDSEAEGSVACGDGNADVAVVDTADTAAPDCETVELPPVTPPGGGNPPGGGSAPDLAPPNTLISSGPRGRVRSRVAKFKFGSSEPGSAFQCKLDARKWSTCAASKTYRKLKVGRHTLLVRAIDPAGNVDPTPARRAWRIVG